MAWLRLTERWNPSLVRKGRLKSQNLPKSSLYAGYTGSSWWLFFDSYSFHPNVWIVRICIYIYIVNNFYIYYVFCLAATHPVYELFTLPGTPSVAFGVVGLTLRNDCVNAHGLWVRHWLFWCTSLGWKQSSVGTKQYIAYANPKLYTRIMCTLDSTFATLPHAGENDRQHQVGFMLDSLASGVA